MEQAFALKQHGHLSLQEQCMLTAEDRKWWANRLKKHFEEQEKAAKGSNSSSGMPSMPSKPSRPSMPKR